MKKIKFFLLLLLFSLAFILRFYKLGQVPTSLNRDEVSLGYNAYSILKTGKDEWGVKYPFSFESFGDYKLPGYIYTLIPFIKIFGLNDFSTRLPSALAGVIMVVTIFLIVQELFDNFYAAFFSALVLAIHPWHLHYSRMAFEANVALTIEAIGVCFLLKARKKPFFRPLSAFFIVLSLFFYNNPYFIIPFILISAFILWKEKWLSKNSINFTISAVLILIFGGLFALLTVGKVNFAKKGVTIFSDWRVHQKVLEKRQYYQPKSLWPRLFHSKYFIIARDWILGYLKTFQASFLFDSKGKHIWNNIHDIGNVYLVGIIFFIIGLFFLLTKAKKQTEKIKKGKIFLLIWLLSGPLPSSITINAPQPTRCHNFLLIWAVTAGLGIWAGWKKLIDKKKKLIYLSLVFLLYFFSFGRYLNLYYFHFPKQMYYKWYNGLREMIVKSGDYQKQTLVISDYVENAYIYALFYEKFDPAVFQKSYQFQKDASGFIYVKKFKGHIFGRPEPFSQYPDNSLIIAPAQEITSQAEPVYSFNGEDEVYWKAFLK